MKSTYAKVLDVLNDAPTEGLTRLDIYNKIPGCTDINDISHALNKHAKLNRVRKTTQKRIGKRGKFWKLTYKIQANDVRTYKSDNANQLANQFYKNMGAI